MSTLFLFPSNTVTWSFFPILRCLFFCFPRLFCSVWPRPVHSEHQIRFTGRHHTSPPAAKQRASHPDSFPRKRHSVRTNSAVFGRPLYLTPPRSAHPSDVYTEPELPWSCWHVAYPRPQSHPHSQPHTPPSRPHGPPPLPDPRGGALAARHAPLWQPNGTQPHSAAGLLQPCQPGFSARGLCQRTGKAQLSLTLGYPSSLHLWLPEKTHWAPPTSLCHSQTNFSLQQKLNWISCGL